MLFLEELVLEQLVLEQWQPDLSGGRGTNCGTSCDGNQVDLRDRQRQ
jgi:hypothetical protein